MPDHLKNVKLETVNGPEKDDYRYPHDYGEHFVDQEYVPTATKYYEPTKQGYEDVIGKRIATWSAMQGV